MFNNKLKNIDINKIQANVCLLYTSRMDVKVLQYIMGHAHIDVTMEVYNHIGELTRIENEIARLDLSLIHIYRRSYPRHRHRRARPCP